MQKICICMTEKKSTLPGKYLHYRYTNVYAGHKSQ